MRCELGTTTRSLIGEHRARANPDPPDGSCDVPHLDDIAHLHRALIEQDEAGDEVVHHVLQTEADPHPEGADEDREPGQLRPRGEDGEHRAHGDHGVGRGSRDGGVHSTAQVAGLQPLVEDEPHQPPEQHRDPQGDGERQHVTKRHVDRAHFRAP
jgi:hypothetical protein